MSERCNTGGQENCITYKMKSVQILISTLSLSLSNFPSPPQHPLTAVASSVQ